MIKGIAGSVAVALIVFAASAQAQDVEGCLSARYSAGGKYASCEAKAAAKGFNDGAFLKCRQKYAAAWSKLGPKYPGTDCDGARFVDNGNGGITDYLTLLVWEKKTAGTVNELVTWSETPPHADGPAFYDFLDDLNSGATDNNQDWRLPTVFELHTIASTDAFPCAIPCAADPIFLPTQSIYWSSSTYPSDPSKARAVAFDNITTALVSKTAPLFVRGVRAGF